MPEPTERPTSVADRFLQVITTRRARRNPPVENSEFLAMLFRMIRALEARAVDDPQMLIQVIALTQRLEEVANVAIAMNHERYRVDPMRGASQGECAAILGISKQAASQRGIRGRTIVDRRIAAAGAVKFSEATREREAIQAAQDHAVTSLAEYRAQHRRSA